MKQSKLLGYALISMVLILLTGCGPSQDNSESETLDVKVDIDPASPDTNTTLPPQNVDDNSTQSAESNKSIDLNDYIPNAAKTLSCQISTANTNTNGSQIYYDNKVVSTTHDGLDMHDYIEYDKFITMSATDSFKSTAIVVNDTNVTYKQSATKERAIPRYYDDNDTVTFTLQFKMDLNVTIDSGSTVTTYSDLYESNSSYCKMWHLGEYNLSSVTYSDAIELKCYANQAKTGTADSVYSVIYDRNYTSVTTLLPEIGIVDVNYTSTDSNYTVRCQPE